MWQRRNVASVALLAQQFIDEGFVDAEQCGDCSLGSDSTFNCLNYSFS
jgi:hypothetical protein